MVFYGTIQQQLGEGPVVSGEEMRRLEEEKKAGELKAKILSEELDITITKLKAGEITSITQIPEEQRKYLNIPEGFFGKVEEYSRQKAAYESSIREQSEWALARKLILSGKGWVAQDVPSLRSKIKRLREEGLESTFVTGYVGWGELSATRESLATGWKPIQVQYEPGYTPTGDVSKDLYHLTRGSLKGWGAVPGGEAHKEYLASIKTPEVYQPTTPTWDIPTVSRIEKVPQQPTISAYEGAVIPYKSYKQTWWAATGEAIKRIPEGARMSLAGGITEFDIGEGVRYIFDPYKYAGKLKGEEKLFVAGEPQFGTIVSEEYLPTEAKPFIGTKFEFAEMKGFEPSPELYKRTGTRVSKYAPAVIEMGGLIGASFISPTMAIGVVPAYIFGRSTKQVVTSPTISGKALGVAGMGLGLAGFGFGMAGLQTSITMGEMKSAIAYKPQLKLGTREILKGGIIKDVYVSRYQVGGTKVIKEAEIYSKLIKGRTYALGGRGSIFVRTTEYMTGKEITYIAGTKLKGLGFGLGVGTKGWQPSVSVGGVFQAGLNPFTFPPKDTIKSFPSFEIPPTTNFSGVSLKNFTFEPKIGSIFPFL